MEVQNGVAPVENSTEIPQKEKKINKKLPYDPASPLLGMDSKKVEAGTQTNICTSVFTAVLCE